MASDRWPSGVQRLEAFLSIDRTQHLTGAAAMGTTAGSMELQQCA